MDKDVLQRVVDYLASKPYVETFQFIRDVQASTVLVEEELTGEPKPQDPTPEYEVQNTDSTEELVQE